MNVIGDVGIMIAIFTMFRRFGVLDYDGVFSRAGSFPSGDPVITAICLLLLVGAVAKSAQLPLQTWLPDAMEGPTPVSALIHAATMVTAGVYLIARCHVLYDLSPFGSLMVACLGGTTAFIAATIAVVQMDIKRVLAYSTMSQIGYMFLGAGDGAYGSAMFHLMTHAFFKALLFMGAGSVIHALGGEQDLRKMGALRSKLPRTYLLFTIGVIAIAGIPPLSGFWSKDEILTHTLALGDWHIALWVVGEITAALTVFYMFRMWYLCFHGRSRVDRQVAAHIHEAPSVMLIPMSILAVLSIVGGFIQIPGWEQINNWLTPDFVLEFPQVPSPHFGPVAFSWGGFVLMILLIIGSWALARDMYGPGLRGQPKGFMRYPYVFLVHKWYFDELYNLLFERTTYALAALAWWLDRRTIDGIVNGVAQGTADASDDLRPVESGFVRTYALSIFGGVILLVAIAISQR
jgi:NADH-quinone oxidoreductase subunit L